MADSRFAWRIASYSTWNDRLLEHFLRADRNGARVYRISATPEELVAVTEDPLATADEVIDAFLDAVRQVLPKGKSFCGFCFDDYWWTPASAQVPQFFGMLCFTCLVAAGYPERTGTFHERIYNLIGTHDHLRELPKLWENLADWTRQHSEYADLQLPPYDDYRKVIGYSYYLAFPNRQDRGVLAEVLASEDLLGCEPPITPVVATLQRARDRFSSDFQAALDHFLDHFLRGGRDPIDSAFWRAIQTEALYGPNETRVAETQAASATLLATWDEDETLLVRVAVGDGVVIEGTTLQLLPIPIDDYLHFLSDESGDVDALMRRVLTNEISMCTEVSSRIRQGVLLFQEDVGDEYKLAIGDEINGVSVALVREDRVDGFRLEFRGRAEASRFDGWREIQDCTARQLSELPAGLQGVTQLLYTTKAARPRLVGGIRIEGGYLWMPMLAPIIRAPDAIEIEVIDGELRSRCKASTEEGEWSFPSGLSIRPPVDIQIRAKYETVLSGCKVLREAVTSCRFVEVGHGYEYRVVGSGAFWRESCSPEQLAYEGKTPISLDVTSSNESDSADLLEMEPSARYLGPGLGEMSQTPRDGFTWLVVGTRSNPRDLVFIGNLDSPVLPDGGVSSHPGDRRAWVQAFMSKKTRITALVRGKYIPVEQEPRLRAIYDDYRRARQQTEGREPRTCSPSGIESSMHEERATVTPTPQALSVVEALAALGRTRSGLPWRKLESLMEPLTGTRNYLLWQQVIRAWTEAGFVDLLRRQNRSQTMIVPRPPRFVMVRRGPTVDATLVGLVGSDDLLTIQAVLGDVKTESVCPSTPFQPSTLRLLHVEPERIIQVSSAVGLQPPEWLNWPNLTAAPSYLSVGSGTGGLIHEIPSEAYAFDAKWDWGEMTFKTDSGGGVRELVEVERRRHPERSSIYVVIVDGEAILWCHFQNWALLRAAELRDQPPFSLSSDGVARSSGRSPIHLPLPFGRLCTVLGAGQSGPELDSSGLADGYRYPFGVSLQRLLRKALPSSWIVEV